MPARRLEGYRSRRDFSATGEPVGGKAQEGTRPRFVLQEHHARRLHWDLRLEHDGVAVSWAIPNGIPTGPGENRLAVHTEDHPLEYLDWEGEIPAGHYGAGTMSIWDRGTYEPLRWEPGKVEVAFNGERLRGRYGLFPIGRGEGEERDWLIHRMDPPEDPQRLEMPSAIVPMLARSATRPPRDPERWSFEVKWDGVRAIAYCRPGRLQLQSRNGNDITASYPEVRGILEQLGMSEAVLDGEIVAFDGSLDPPRPSFGRLQRRMHVVHSAAIRRLQAEVPVIYVIFDLLHLDGESLLGLPYSERRRRLEALSLEGPAWRVPGAQAGRGAELLAATELQGLEGIVAKRLDSRYEPGARNGCWLKIKHHRRQELVIGGWLPGEGRRAKRIGALLVGYHEGVDGPLRYAGRVGTGFTQLTLDRLAERLEPLSLSAGESPFEPRPKLPRGARFVAPELVCEVEFSEWTRDGVLRAPSFKGLRDDVDPETVTREPGGAPEPAAVTREPEGAPEPAAAQEPAAQEAAAPTPGFEVVEPLPRGGRLVRVDGRELRCSNWGKVLFPDAGFTKGDLICYYARVAEVLLPHLQGRALTLKRYPNGVQSAHFYEKQAPRHRPDWVAVREINGVRYVLANERPALVWLGNLADVELHTSLAMAERPQHPTLLVFDLDPGPPAGIVECCRVALVIRGLFRELGLQTVVKTSGSKGLQVYLPLNDPAVGYGASKPFARRIAELLEQRMPELVVSRMARELRAGKVLVDWSQNDEHKTTVTAYSVRALDPPAVSTPLRWEEVGACRETQDGASLRFSPEQVLARIQRYGDLFAPAATLTQRLPSLS
jgi:bifunctional non-homologous end joining protein LigD